MKNNKKGIDRNRMIDGSGLFNPDIDWNKALRADESNIQEDTGWVVSFSAADNEPTEITAKDLIKQTPSAFVISKINSMKDYFKNQNQDESPETTIQVESGKWVDDSNIPIEGRFEAMKDYLTAWAKRKHVKYEITGDLEDFVTITILSSKKLLTEETFLDLEDVNIPNDPRLTKYGKSVLDELEGTLCNKYSHPNMFSNEEVIPFTIQLGQEDYPYQANVDMKDISLEEVLKRKMDAAKTLERNSNLSVENREAIENYVQLREMFNN